HTCQASQLETGMSILLGTGYCAAALAGRDGPRVQADDPTSHNAVSLDGIHTDIPVDGDLHQGAVIVPHQAAHIDGAAERNGSQLHVFQDRRLGGVLEKTEWPATTRAFSVQVRDEVSQSFEITLEVGGNWRVC